MTIHKFTNPDGSAHVWVNLEAIVAVTPTEDGKVIIITSFGTFKVDAAQYEAAMSKKDTVEDRHASIVNRLVQALDRLAVRIPTSIRLHM